MVTGKRIIVIGGKAAGTSAASKARRVLLNEKLERITGNSMARRRIVKQDN
jgi:hypothetical protein